MLFDQFGEQLGFGDAAFGGFQPEDAVSVLADPCGDLFARLGFGVHGRGLFQWAVVNGDKLLAMNSVSAKYHSFEWYSISDIAL